MGNKCNVLLDNYMIFEVSRDIYIYCARNCIERMIFADSILVYAQKLVLKTV